MVKKFIKFAAIYFFICFFFLEIVLIYSNKYLSTNILFYFPDTSLKQELLIKNKMRSKSDRSIGDKIIFKKNNLSRKLTVPKKTIFRESDLQDKIYGATNYFYYNDGFCNKNYDYKNKKNKILAFGDSFTYCTFITPENAWIKNITYQDEMFIKINYGMTGIGLYEQYRLMNEMVDENTKIIISAIYEGNDFRDILRHKNTIKNNDIVENKKLSEPQKENILKKIIKKYFGKSYSFNYLAASRNILIAKLSNNSNFNFKFQNSKTNLEYNINNIDQDEVFIAKKIFNKKFKSKEIENYFLEPIIKINKFAIKNNLTLIYIYIPSAHTGLGENVIFEDNKVKNYLKKMSNIQREVFNEICNNNNLNCIDTTDNIIYSNSSGLVTHFPSNLHLTKKGHEVVAKTITSYLKKIN